MSESVEDVRSNYPYADSKTKAHVTLCVLALLFDRYLGSTS